MGFRLEKEKTGSTPYILIDADKNYMRLEGKSFCENAGEFYTEIMDWLDEHLTTDFDVFTFDCDLIYFNSSTAKLLYNMLRSMDKAAVNKSVIVNWITDENNDVTVEFAEDFMEELENLSFNLILN